MSIMHQGSGVNKEDPHRVDPHNFLSQFGRTGEPITWHSNCPMNNQDLWSYGTKANSGEETRKHHLVEEIIEHRAEAAISTRAVGDQGRIQRFLGNHSTENHLPGFSSCGDCPYHIVSLQSPYLSHECGIQGFFLPSRSPSISCCTDSHSVSFLVYSAEQQESEESPPDKDQDQQANAGKRTVLAEQQLPIDSDGSSSVLGTVLSQSAADLAHALEAISSVQQILDVFGHDLGDIAELVVQLVEVLRSARVRVGGFGAGDEGVELHECVGAHRGGKDLLQGVGGAEFRGEIGEVGEG